MVTILEGWFELPCKEARKELERKIIESDLSNISHFDYRIINGKLYMKKEGYEKMINLRKDIETFI